LVPTGLGEGGRVAPGVIIKGKEVATDSVITAVHVRSHLVAVRLDISSRVSNRNLSESTSVNVGLDITSHSLDVRRTVGGGIVVDDLVGGKEKQSVVILGELLNGGEDALQVVLVVRRLRPIASDGVERRVDVEG
jgi:hypothetical protein